MNDFHPKLIEACPWLLDETPRPFAVRFSEEENRPVIVEMPFREFPRRLRTSRYLRFATEYDWRCFYSGVRCYGTGRKAASDPMRYKHYPWAITRAPLRLALDRYPEGERCEWSGPQTRDRSGGISVIVKMRRGEAPTMDPERKARLSALTDAEIDSLANSDPDNQPLTQDQLRRAHADRMARLKPGTRPW